ncbi:unnamed protein product, partial [marine sediment metagenome]
SLIIALPSGIPIFTHLLKNGYVSNIKRESNYCACNERTILTTAILNALSLKEEAKTVWYVPERGGYISGMCYGWVRSFIENKKEKLVIGYTTFDENIDQSGTAAYVRFRFLIEDGEYSRDTTDYLTLLKFGEDWNIVNKSGFTIDKTVEEIAKIKEDKTKTSRNIPEELELITLKLKIYAEAFNEWDIEKIRAVFHPEVRVNYVDDETNKFRCQTRSIGVWKEVFE